MELKGKTAFITGGGGGIGAGIGEALHEKGMNIVLADIDLGYAEAEAARIGGGAMPLALDVTSLDSWAAACATAQARFGPVDVLCNNAGVVTAATALDQLAPGEFARLMAVNVTGVFNGVITFAGDMRERGNGHIVNTSSMNGLAPYGTMAAYSTTKFAVLGMSDALRQELAPHGVGVSTLFPGRTRSRLSLGRKIGVAPDVSMDPVWIGRAVARAIERNEPYIATHPEYRAGLEARFAEILDAFGEPAQPGYGVGGSARLNS